MLGAPLSPGAWECQNHHKAAPSCPCSGLFSGGRRGEGPPLSLVWRPCFLVPWACPSPPRPRELTQPGTTWWKHNQPGVSCTHGPCSPQRPGPAGPGDRGPRSLCDSGAYCLSRVPYTRVSVWLQERPLSLPHPGETASVSLWSSLGTRSSCPPAMQPTGQGQPAKSPS